MYTRCPSCRAQISFELPQSADSFPEGYKHKIKCPSCGVTIGVKIPRVDATATVQPTYTPANPAASTFEPTYTAAAPVPETRAEHRADEKAAKKANKKSGIGRNILVMILSLILVAIPVVSYLLATGKIPADKLPVWILGITEYNGIAYIELIVKDFEAFKATFSASAVGGVYIILQALFFLLAGVNFLVALISAIGKKYGRAWNFISALLILACAVIILFAPLLVDSNVKIAEYFMSIIQAKQYAIFAPTALGLLLFIFALCFCKSLNRKVK